jgi:hypothetical protein
MGEERKMFCRQSTLIKTLTDDDTGDESPSSNGDKLQVCDLSEAPKFALRPRCYLSDQTKNMSWAGHVACIGDMRNICII